MKLLVLAMCVGLALSADFTKRSAFGDFFINDAEDKRSLSDLKAELIRTLEERLDQDEEQTERRAMLQEAEENRAQAEEGESESMKAQLVRALQERLNQERSYFDEIFEETKEEDDAPMALFENEADEKRAKAEAEKQLEDLKAQLISALEQRKNQDDDFERELFEDMPDFPDN